jgi:uncharacterized protein YaaW (UPF0174 family)
MPAQYLIQKGNRALFDVLEGMSGSQLRHLRYAILKEKSDDDLSGKKLRWAIAADISRAGSYSFKFWAVPRNYDAIVRQVALRLKLSATMDSEVDEIERAILFKVIEKSLDRMTPEQRIKFSKTIEIELKAKGIDQKIAFKEVASFVKFMSMDVGGTAGGLVLAAPGLSGMAGLNFLQWVVLKGVILTSGHIAAGGALLGLGTGGILMGIAGAAGPVAVGLAIVYTAHILAGPAFRKLVPAICFIAAKRIELRAALPEN